MANLIITTLTSPERIRIVFNDYANDGMMPLIGYYSKTAIKSVLLKTSHVDLVGSLQSDVIQLSHTPNDNGYMVVDSIDGNVPSSLSDLAERLSALIADTAQPDGGLIGGGGGLF